MNHRLAALLICIAIIAIATGIIMPSPIIAILTKIKGNEELLRSTTKWSGIISAVSGLVLGVSAFVFWGTSEWLGDLREAQSNEARGKSEKVVKALQGDLKTAREGLDDIKKKQGPRKINGEAIARSLKDKPRMKVEVAYQPDDREAYNVASTTALWLGKGPKDNGAGWEVSGPRPFNKDDILPDWNWDGSEPIDLKVGAISGVGMIISESLNRRLPPGADMSSSNAVGAFSLAMIAAGLWV